MNTWLVLHNYNHGSGFYDRALYFCVSRTIRAVKDTIPITEDTKCAIAIFMNILITLIPTKKIVECLH